MHTIRRWLGGLGLDRYADAFEHNDIDLDVLPELNDAELERLGVSLGHRMRLRLALRAMAGAVQTRSVLPDAHAAGADVDAEAGERRQVTVLFCDLVGSTALSNRLDPEDYRALLARYHAHCIRHIQQFEGYVAQVQGDGILAYFGYPLAHEGEAERALRAALQIVDSVSAIEVGAQARLEVRIGVASGLVVVSDVFAAQKSAVGETPNLAQRLQTIAQPGQVMVADRTRSLASGAFDYLDMGRVALKGIAEPAQVWRVMGRSPPCSRFEAATRGAIAPMVGREQEVGLLVDRWALSRSGEGQVLLLQGEPGIGKSRLLHAFRERLGSGIEVTLQYQCSTYYTNSAFYPIAEQLERTLGLDIGQSVDQRLDRIETLIARAFDGPRDPLRCSLLAQVLAIPCTTRYAPLDLPPQQQKLATIDLLLDLIAHTTAGRASVVVFEDIHWADPTTLDVLGRLVDRAETLPLLVLVTCRPHALAAWTARSHVTSIALTRLSRAQSAAVVLCVAGKPLPSDLVNQIVEKTDGVPLFLEELTKAALESQSLADAGDRYDYRSQADRLIIPSTLRDSLMARLDRLIPVKEIAQIGACIGREFSHDLLRAVSPMPAAALDDALEKLIASELVFRRGVPPQASYIFKHALVQDAAYDSLLKGRRLALHAKIAATLEADFPGKTQTEPELLAHHFSEAGNHDKAVVYWQRSGDLAQRRFALQEAVHSYRRATQHLHALPSTPANMALQVRIAVKWADLIVPSAEVIAALATAEEHAEALGNVDALAEVMSYAGQLLFYMGRLEAAVDKLQRVIAMAGRTRRADRVGSAYRCLGQTYLMGYSRYAEAMQAIECALPIAQSTGNHFEQSCCHGVRGLELGFRGDFRASFDSFGSALHVARVAQERSIECWNLKWNAFILCVKGDWDDAATMAETGSALARKIENVWAGNWCTLMSAYARFMLGRDDSLVEVAEPAVDALAGTTCVAVARCLLAEMQCLSGNVTHAANAVERARADLRHGSYFCAQIRAIRVSSMCAAAGERPDWNIAASRIDEAVRAAREQGRLPDLAICLFQRAQWSAHGADRAASESCLREAADLFGALDMPWWAAQASAWQRALMPQRSHQRLGSGR